MDRLKTAGRSSQVAGIEWCTNLDDEIQKEIQKIGCLELIPENFFQDLVNFSPKKLFKVIDDYQVPVIIHSIGLSLGSLEPFKRDYFKKILEISNHIPTKISFSDHLCMTERNGSEIGQLTTIPYDQETLDCVSKKLETIQKLIHVPFAIENITHCFVVPGQEMTEPEFINKLVDRTGVGILLDLNNIYTNGVNFGVDPYQWLNEIDLNHVNSIHLAGGYVDENKFLQDGHCEKVPEEVWTLFEYVMQTAGRPITTIVERTWRNEERGLQPILEDQLRAQSIMDRLSSYHEDYAELRARQVGA
jgi:uncharacterized protein (UPF0276 family)